VVLIWVKGTKDTVARAWIIGPQPPQILGVATLGGKGKAAGMHGKALKAAGHRAARIPGKVAVMLGMAARVMLGAMAKVMLGIVAKEILGTIVGNLQLQRLVAGTVGKEKILGRAMEKAIGKVEEKILEKTKVLKFLVTIRKDYMLAIYLPILTNRQYGMCLVHMAV
jgi:hypothetical protein